nr:hypothetical protein [Frankia tisae]
MEWAFGPAGFAAAEARIEELAAGQAVARVANEESVVRNKEESVARNEALAAANVRLRRRSRIGRYRRIRRRSARCAMAPAGEDCPLTRSGRLPAMAGLSDVELDALVEQAVVDAYGEDEQLTAFHAVIGDALAVPFRTTVLGMEVTVTGIDLLPGSGIVAVCARGRHRQAVGILDLPLPTPPPAGAEWIAALRHWAP